MIVYRLSSEAGANNTVGDRQNLHDRVDRLPAAGVRMLRSASAAAHLRLLLPQGQRCMLRVNCRFSKEVSKNALDDARNAETPQRRRMVSTTERLKDEVFVPRRRRKRVQ